MADGFRISVVNRNLISDFDACESNSPGNELMRVYLRVKPLEKTKNYSNVMPVIKCTDLYTVIAYPPPSKAFGYRDAKKTEHSFTFSRVFTESACQKTLFSSVAVDQIKGFLEGFNGLIFAYGTTSSGKTHTLQDSIFKDLHLDEKLQSDLPIDHILSRERTQATPYVGSTENENCEESLHTSDLRFTFWISFAEVYNELVYDLLDPVQCSTTFNVQSSNINRTATTHQKNIFSVNQTCNSFDVAAHRSRKKSLELRTDKNGNVFIKGLHCYPVGSPEEALRLILVGRQCQNVAATRLNQASSRSHSILSIKSVRVMDKDNPKFARISSLTFCDLAGSERSEKAATGGQSQRLREAGNINASLLTLGRCIECLRYNQMHPDNPKLVPYRDSKLTRLFQGFFTGRGKACMIVNASPDPELFDETLHALRFSALATRIIVTPNAVVDSTILHQDDEPQKPSRAQRGQIDRNMKPLKLRTAEPVLATPPTVVPKREDRSKFCVPSPSFNNDFDSVQDLSIIEMDRQPMATPGSPHTPGNESKMELILDAFSKEELIFMVKDLSDKLFEAKGELVEQESKLRQQMCEDMDSQMARFEQLYEEARHAQEQMVVEQSNRRLEQLAQKRDNDHDTDDRGGLKRQRRCSQSDSDSDEETFSHAQQSSQDTPLIDRIHKRREDEEDESRVRLSDLESELADQRDAIDNLSQERDRLRMELTRVEFSSSLLRKKFDAEREKWAKKTQCDSTVQTEDYEVDSVKPTSTLKPPSSLLDDSTLVLNLPKCTVTGVRKYFGNPTSLEQEQRLLSASETTVTPTTVVRRLPGRSDLLRADAENAEKQSEQDRLRNENQHLLARLADLRSCMQSALQEKQEAELELTRLQNVSTIEGTDSVRPSVGLQSFLEHESRLNQSELVDQLQKQVYELEEQFATKHDALMRIEAENERLKATNEDWQERVVIQTNDLSRLRREHVEEQAAMSELRDTFQAQLREAHTRLAEMQSKQRPDRLVVDTQTQTLINRLELLDTSVQTASPARVTHIETSMQVSPCYYPSVGSQTDPAPRESYSPILPIRPVHMISETFKKPPTLANQPSENAHSPDVRSKAKRVIPSRRKRVQTRGKHSAPPQLPSPVPIPVLTSDSECEQMDKENDALQSPIHPTDTDNDSEGEDDRRSGKVGSKKSSRNRAVRSYSHGKPARTMPTRQTRSAVASRRLPPLAESTQLMPDSFFQDELDAAMDHLDVDFQLEEIGPKTRRQRRTRR